MLVIALALLGTADAAKRNEAPQPDVEAVAAELMGRALASDLPMERLVELSDGIGHRLAGSASLDRAIAWAEERMRADGLRTRLEPVQVPVWVRGDASLEVLGTVPFDVPLLALGGSPGTPPIEAEVAVVGSFEELGPHVAGKVVVFDVPFTGYGETVVYRWNGPTEAAKHGAVAALVRSIAPVGLRTPHTGSTDLEAGIPAAAIAAEDAMRLRRLSEAGPVRIRLALGSRTLPDAPSANVIGEVPGRTSEVVVVACHLDSWDVGQGAQDDGAGCVMAMEAGRLVAALPTPPRRTLRVVLYTNEENGLRGAKAYAEAHAGEPHFAAIEADTGSGQPLGFRVDRRGADGELLDPVDPWLAWLAPVSALLAPIGATGITGSWSGADIRPLVLRGVLGVGLDQDTTDYWPIHHTEADTVDKVDPVLLRRNTAAMTVMAWWLSEQTAPVLD